MIVTLSITSISETADDFIRKTRIRFDSANEARAYYWSVERNLKAVEAALAALEFLGNEALLEDKSAAVTSDLADTDMIVTLKIMRLTTMRNDLKNLLSHTEQIESILYRAGK